MYALAGREEAREMPLFPQIAPPRLLGIEMGHNWMGGGGPAAVAGSEVPQGRSKETHKLHNKGETVFISFDTETP